MDKFGDIVRSKREAKGLLLRQLAAMIDVDAAILSKIERGERKARREQVIRIADALEFNVNENFFFPVIESVTCIIGYTLFSHHV